MSIKELLKRNRSYRRFFQNEPVEEKKLIALVSLTQLVASAANKQPLKYAVIFTPEHCAEVFKHLRWAAALPDWPGPVEGERPAAYIVILGDTRVSRNFFCDHGIAAQCILLGAVEQGLGGCMIASVDRKGLAGTLGLADHFEILLVLALGRPKEEVVLEIGWNPDKIPYWRDNGAVHHVPKRSLEELLVLVC